MTTLGHTHDKPTYIGVVCVLGMKPAKIWRHGGIMQGWLVSCGHILPEPSTIQFVDSSFATPGSGEAYFMQSYLSRLMRLSHDGLIDRTATQPSSNQRCFRVAFGYVWVIDGFWLTIYEQLDIFFCEIQVRFGSSFGLRYWQLDVVSLSELNGKSVFNRQRIHESSPRGTLKCLAFPQLINRIQIIDKIYGNLCDDVSLPEITDFWSKFNLCTEEKALQWSGKVLFKSGAESPKLSHEPTFREWTDGYWKNKTVFLVQVAKMDLVTVWWIIVV